MRVREEAVGYVKGILSGLAAIFIAEFVFFWPFLSLSKATGAAVIQGLLIKSVVSPRFWIVGVLAFGLFIAASRANTILRVVFFWTPTVAVSAVGLSILVLYAYLFTVFKRQ